METQPPETCDEALQADWTHWVIGHTLPPLPNDVLRGTSVPVARWIEGTIAAVMFVRWFTLDHPSREGLECHVEVMERRGGEWRNFGSGGSGWCFPPLVRPSGIGPRTAEVFGEGSYGHRERVVRIAYGIAGADSAVVSVVADRERSIPIESPFGAFIAAFDARRAPLRELDANDEILHSENWIAT